MSDPTLDPGLMAFAPPPSPKTKKPKPPPRVSNRDGKYNSSGSTGSYHKRISDETDAVRSTDEAPSSEDGEGGNKAVDNIVAAALAYAEKAHGEGSTRDLGLGKPSRQEETVHRQSTLTAGASSIHSFFTKSENGSQKGDKSGSGGGGHRESRSSGAANIRGSHSTGNPQFLSQSGTAPVDDLVARAISQAEGELASGSPVGQKPQRPPLAKINSEYSAAFSVGSMYTEETEDFSKQNEMQYDC
jgi:hypothetical protein